MPGQPVMPWVYDAGVMKYVNVPKPWKVLSGVVRTMSNVQLTMSSTR